MKRKKLLVIHPIIAPYRVDFFNSLSQTFDTEIVLFYRNLVSQSFDYSRICKEFKFTPSFLCNLYRGIKLPKGLFSKIKSFHPNIILANECNPTTIASLLYRFFFNQSCIVVTIVDDSFDMARGNNNFSLKHALAKKIVLPLCDQIICVEPRVAEYYKKKYGSGIYFPIISNEEKVRSQYRQVLPLSEKLARDYHLEGKNVLLFVGRLVHLKNVQMVIPAFLRLDNEDNVFVIVGDGPMKSELEHLCSENENIIFTGRLEGDELRAWYNIASVFILPSYQEAFGAVTNEALIAGCYSLISQKAGSQCLIKPGINGELIDPMSEENIEQALQNALSKATHVMLPLRLKENLMLETFSSLMNNIIQDLMSL